MNHDRLRILLETYGADPQRWPPEERDAALALLERDPVARSVRDRAARLDAVLDADVDDEPSSALVAHVLAAAVPSPTSGAGMRVTQPGLPARRRPRVARGRRALRYGAAAVPFAAAAAVALWLATRTPDFSSTTREVPLAALGTYQTPADELLAVNEIDLFETDLWVGCPDSVLGCLEDDESIELDPQPHSARQMGTHS